MCVVSMVSDHYLEKWKEREWWPDGPSVEPTWPYETKPWVTPMVPWDPNKVSREEFDRVVRELEDLKQLLKRAKKYDEDNNEPDCEIDEKVETLKKIAKAFGVEIEIK